jgi:Type VI secretion system VasI, EvfG, VC_A0118
VKKARFPGPFEHHNGSGGQPARGRKSVIQMSLRTAFIGIAVAAIILVFVGALTFNYVAVQQPLRQVLAADPRNQVVTANAHFDGWIRWSALVVDVTNVSAEGTRLDVFRTFLEYAAAMKGRRFERVVLACRGVKKFSLDGGYFQQLGREYEAQNPIYTIRTFPSHVTTMDGSKPFSEYEGGMLEVLKQETDQFAVFNDQWYVTDLQVSAGAEPSPAPASAAAEPVAEVPRTAADGWILHESRNKMDNTPELFLSKSGSEGANLIIRCSEHKTEAFVNTDAIVDNDNVRIRLDASAPLRQQWSKSTDGQALFAPDAINFARDLAKSHTFLFEFTPFEKRDRTVNFDVSGLDSMLLKVSDMCGWDAVDKIRAKARAADAALRARIAPHVHPCQDNPNTWCWSDPEGVVFQQDTYGGETREQAMREALRNATWGLAFKGSN